MLEQVYLDWAYDQIQQAPEGPALDDHAWFSCAPWAKRLQYALPDPALETLLPLPRTQAFLFSGPPGVGKRATAFAMAASLGERGYRFVYLTGAELNAPEEEVRHDRLSALFQQVEEHTPLCIFFEDFSLCRQPLALEGWLADELALCKSEDLPVTVILSAQEQERISPRLLRYLTVCRFSPPDMDARIAFFRAFFPECKASASLLGGQTKSFSYSQLELVVYLCRLSLRRTVIREYLDRPETLEELRQRGTVPLETDAIQQAVKEARMPEPVVPVLAPVSGAGQPSAAPSQAPSSHPEQAAFFNDKGQISFERVQDIEELDAVLKRATTRLGSVSSSD